MTATTTTNANAPNPLEDQDARTAIREELDTTLVVEASAGAGKTTELIRRIVALLESGRAKLSTLVAVTFTEKAAGEMKLRLRTALERARHSARTATDRDDPAATDRATRLDLAIRELEVAHIGTIHAFCADLLRERPVEARIDPLFAVADDAEARRLFGEAFELWFQRVLGAPRESYPGAHRVLRRKMRDDGPRGALFEAGYSLLDQRDFDAPWTRPPVDRPKELDRLVNELRDLGALAERADDKRSDPNDGAWLYMSLEAVRKFVAELDRKEATRGGERDHDGLEADLRGLARERLWGWKGWGRFYEKSTQLLRDDVLARRALVKGSLDAYLTLADADLAACLREELRPLLADYERKKAEAGKLDFLDLLLVTKSLLDTRPDVRRDLRARYTHLLIDEFQDTDPLQAHVLLSLGRAADDDGNEGPTVAGKLFFVGDPKQSIYRFRRADVAFYESVKRDLVASGAKLVHLSTSFRSVPGVQSLVNASFLAAMIPNAEGSQATYVPLSGVRTNDPEAPPPVIALPVPRPYSTKTGKVTNWSVDDSFPDAVGAFVDWLLRESKYTLRDPSGRRVNGKPARIPLDASHVCLLFKRFSAYGGDVTRPYVRALEARRIPHVLVGGRGFHEREEVLALRNAANAIEFPFDELSVYATLKGPLFCFEDSAIFGYRTAHKSLDPRRAATSSASSAAVVLDEHSAKVGEGLAILKELHASRNRRPYADTLSELLERTSAHAGFAFWPTGEQALANVLRVLDIARRTTFATGMHSFRGFVDKLMEDAERGRVEEAFVVEEGSQGVRMMTVHRAKGLEFPIVILVDPTARPTHTEPSRYVSAEKRIFAAPLCGAAPYELSREREQVLRHDYEESVRLLYVATTRARDVLVVPVVGDGPLEDSWMAPLVPAVYPARPGMPLPIAPPVPFGKDSVLDRPDHARVTSTVVPGFHAPRAGDHEILVFDPKVLSLGKEDEAGLRQQKILAADELGLGDESIARFDAWVAKRAAAHESASKPSVRVETPTELKERATETVAVTVTRTSTPREGRPHGKRYGVLVHGLLAEAPFDGTHHEALPALARGLGRTLGATDDEIAFATKAAAVALDHPLLATARASTDIRREVGVTQVLESEGGTTLVEGVIDLAFLAPDGTFTLVDYKTDVNEAPRLKAYEAQLAIYARGIREATGKDVSAVLLLV